MMPSFKQAIIITTILSTIGGISCATTSKRPKSEHGQNCTNHLQTIDRCSSQATYSFVSGTNPFPRNANEMKQSCDRIVEGVKCLKIYGKCLSSIARRTLNSYTTARSRHSRGLCSNLDSPKASNFWQAYDCIITHKNSLMHASEKELIGTIQLMALNSSIDWDDRFHQACCAATVYKAKVLKEVAPECARFKDTTEDMLNSMVGELLDSACPDANRLTTICPKLSKVSIAKDWKAVSLTSAGLDLIVALSDSAKN